MIQFFQSIIDFLLSVQSIVRSFVDGIFQLISMIPGALAMVNSSVAAMPSVLVAFAVGMISVSVVYLIIGR